jgi:hypothetical protein
MPKRVLRMSSWFDVRVAVTPEYLGVPCCGTPGYPWEGYPSTKGDFGVPRSAGYPGVLRGTLGCTPRCIPGTPGSPGRTPRLDVSPHPDSQRKMLQTFRKVRPGEPNDGGWGVGLNEI